MKALKKRGLTPEDFIKLEEKKPKAFGRAIYKGLEIYLDELQGKSKKKSEMSPALKALLDDE